MFTITSLPPSTHVPLRPHRRRLVLALYGGLAVAVFAIEVRQSLYHYQGLPSVILLALALAALLLAGLGYRALMRRTVINLPHPTTAVLDERQRAVRDSAYRTAYRLVASAIAALFIALVFLNGDALLARFPAAASGLLLYLFAVASTLPTAVIAWTEPDSPDD